MENVYTLKQRIKHLEDALNYFANWPDSEDVNCEFTRGWNSVLPMVRAKAKCSLKE